MHVLVYVEGVIYQMDEHNERLSANQDDRQDVDLPGECTPTHCKVFPLLHTMCAARMSCAASLPGPASSSLHLCRSSPAAAGLGSQGAAKPSSPGAADAGQYAADATHLPAHPCSRLCLTHTDTQHVLAPPIIITTTTPKVAPNQKLLDEHTTQQQVPSCAALCCLPAGPALLGPGAKAVRSAAALPAPARSSARLHARRCSRGPQEQIIRL